MLHSVPAAASLGRVCDYRIMAEENEWRAIGERLRRTRLIAGMSQAELGKPSGLDRTMVAKIEAGTRRISALELTQLSSALGVPIGYLLEPIPEVVSRRGSAMDEDFDSAVAQESGRLEIVLAIWLSDLRQLIELGVLHPRPLLAAKRSADNAASAREIALWAREALGCQLDPVGSMAEVCERAGQFVLAAEVPGEGASAIDGDVAAAVVSLNADPGRRRATAAHELGHLVLGDEYSNDLGVHASRPERENVIDEFAAEFLLPSPVLASIGASGVSRGQLVEVAARYRVSWSLALRQAVRSGVLDAESQRAMARSRPTRSEFLDALGWSPQPDLESVRVPPGYAHAVLEAVRMAAITPSRAVELLHGQADLADLPPDDEADDEP
jgi:transcriptional regulator with XRE-family HTH domain/Zn-dependent peptidase ImmA (M78 family)